MLGGCLLVQKRVEKNLLSWRTVKALPQHSCTAQEGTRQQQHTVSDGGDVTDLHYLMTNSDFSLRKAMPMPEAVVLHHSLDLAQVLNEGHPFEAHMLQGFTFSLMDLVAGSGWSVPTWLLSIQYLTQPLQLKCTWPTKAWPATSPVVVSELLQPHSAGW